MLSATSAKPLPVLVVDDDSALIRTLADILRFHGYAPETALTGREGLAKAQSHAPALAVVDLRLPDMDGVELASRLHELSELTQVVVLTGNASVESAIAAMRQQSIDYLVKPVQIDQLLQVVSVAGERWQRRRAEEKLRESDERFRRVVESDMLGIMFFDMTGAIYDANKAFLDMVGYSRAQLDAGAVDWRHITPAEYQQLDRQKAAELDRSGVVAAYEKEYIRVDGTRVPVLVGAAKLEGERDGGVSFVLDISDRKAAELALADRARQQAAVARFGQLALTVDETKLFEEAVLLVWRTLDVPMVTILERRTDGQTLVHKAQVGMAELARSDVRVPLTPQTMAGRAVLEKEPVVVHDVTTAPRFSRSEILRSHQVRGAVCVAIPGGLHPFGTLAAFDTEPRDFTQDDVNFLKAIANVLGSTMDRHRAERAFRQSQRMEAIGRLASGVAHDFNNMLSAMTGYAEIVLHDLAPDDRHREDIGEILNAAARAAGLTRQLLAFSRQQVMQPRTLNLNDVVTGIEKMVQRLAGQDTELVLRLDPHVDWVKADPGQLEQVLLNLCVNARDAIPPDHGGRITIETMNAPLESVTQETPITGPAATDYVMLCVTDNGTGMDAETRARIFEPFFTTKGPEKGTGLGLATVYGIVKQSQGEIYVYSEPGRGTSFKIFLPISDEVPRVQRPDAATPPARVRSNRHPTVLLADDEEAIRALMQRGLKHSGFDVLIAADGHEALRLLEQYGETVDVLVTDTIMPGMTGIELARRVRRRRPEMKVIFLSGFAPGAVVDGEEIGATGHFMQKPFGVSALAAKLREVLDGPERPAELLDPRD